jgi:hypothetical protein
MKTLLWISLVACASNLGQSACASPPCCPQPVVYDTVYEERQITCFRTVFEKHSRDVLITLCKPVFHTAMKECRYTVNKIVCEPVVQTVNFTVMKPVYETATREVCYTVMKPVTAMQTVTVDCGYWKTVCGPPAPGCCYPTVHRVWQPQPVSRQVACTQYVPEVHRQSVPVQVCRYVAEERSCQLTTAKYHCVPEEVVAQVPVTTCELIKEQHTQRVNYCVPRVESYVQTVKVARCVPREVACEPSCF